MATRKSANSKEHMNKAIKLLILSDIFVVTGFGLISPILAIFIKENLVGGTIISAGIASTIFLLTKNIVQLPFSKYVDKYDDRVFWLILGTFMIACVPFMYIFAKSIYMLFLAQIIYGFGAALAYPTWFSVWTSHLDKKHKAFEWSLYSACVGIGTAVTAAIGSAISEYIGFVYTFAIVGIMALVGCGILFKLDREKNVEHAIQHRRRLIIKRHNHYPH